MIRPTDPTSAHDVEGLLAWHDDIRRDALLASAWCDVYAHDCLSLADASEYIRRLVDVLPDLCRELLALRAQRDRLRAILSLAGEEPCDRTCRRY